MGSLGDRMKEYEAVPKLNLIKRMPVIMRIDGQAFHTYTKGFQKPWDANMFNAMASAAAYVCSKVSGAKLAYVQSDEISILFVDYEKLNTQPWFDNQVQKMVSLSACYAANRFNQLMGNGSMAAFDARVFNVPKEDVNNYFIWRQQDATRNSIQGLAQSLFSHKELQGKSCNVLQDKMLTEKNVNWNNCDDWQKRGACVYKRQVERQIGVYTKEWYIDKHIPIFTQDKDYVEQYVYPAEENEEKT